MITFRLRCGKGHEYDSMFNSGATFDELKAAKRLVCEVCGDKHVEKGIMAPAIRTGDRRDRIADLEAPEQSGMMVPFIGDLGAAVQAAHDGDTDAQDVLSSGPVLGIISDPDDLDMIRKTTGGKVTVVGTAHITQRKPDDAPKPKKPKAGAKAAKAKAAKRKAPKRGLN